MKIDAISTYQFPIIEEEYDWKSSALYGLSVGFGQDPLDERGLRFVTDKTQAAVPAQAMVLGYPGPWLLDPALDVDYLRLLHGAQAITFHDTLPAAGKVEAHHRVVAVDDKGSEKGATLYLEKRLESGGRPIASIMSTILLRADGGSGGFGEAPAAPPAIPDDTPVVATIDAQTPENAALLYRLNGDVNPLHSDPATAKKAGFERPILHGLCSMGIACRVVLERFCGHDPARLRHLAVRFASPVYPGETLRFQFHETAAGLRFRAFVSGRNVMVLDRGEVQIAE